MLVFVLCTHSYLSDKKKGSKSKKGTKKHFDYLYGHGPWYGHGLGHGYGHGYGHGHGHGHYGFPSIPWGFGLPYGVYGRYVVNTELYRVSQKKPKIIEIAYCWNLNVSAPGTRELGGRWGSCPSCLLLGGARGGVEVPFEL